MKILTATFRVRDDGTVSSHYRAQHMSGADVPNMLRKIRDDIDTELALLAKCPAVTGDCNMPSEEDTYE